MFRSPLDRFLKRLGIADQYTLVPREVSRELVDGKIRVTTEYPCPKLEDWQRANYANGKVRIVPNLPGNEMKKPFFISRGRNLLEVVLRGAPGPARPG